MLEMMLDGELVRANPELTRCLLACIGCSAYSCCCLQNINLPVNEI